MAVLALPFSAMLGVGNDIITQTTQVQNNTAAPMAQFVSAANGVLNNYHDDAYAFAQHLQGALDVLLQHRLFIGHNLDRVGAYGNQLEANLTG